MQQKFKFEGAEYSTESLSESSIKRFLQLQFTQKKLQELRDDAALFHKAKNGYIEDLKSEIVSGKLGVNIGDLLTD